MAWYRDVLGLERRHEAAWGDEPAMVCAGATCIALFPSGATSPPRDASAMRHLAFRTDRQGFLDAQEALKARGITLELQDHGVAHSMYFDDPDGHALEITTYELEAPAAPERIEVLAEDRDVRIERIVSRGHSSPDGFWYDQSEVERVLLLRGAARLEFGDGRTLDLRPGDWVHLAAHERHRVAWTDPDQDTIWLAIFHR